jgi:hypothetical protein
MTIKKKDNSKSKYTFVLIHFGNNPKYLELEIYFLINLRNFTKYDITYLYSINDTPNIYHNIIKSFVTNVVPYDDKDFSFENKTFKSHYKHFNTLRTCNFIYAYTLIEYEKVCICESDMVITKNIDSIFDLKCPAILRYTDDKNIDKNYKMKLEKNKILDECGENNREYLINGGIILFKPSKEMFNNLKNNMNLIINKNCKYPNETLFLYTNSNSLYNIPLRYNFSHYHFKKYNKFKTRYIIHFNESEYKPLNIIKDGWLDKTDNKDKKDIVVFFNENYYIPYHTKIDKIMKGVVSNKL